MAISEYQYLQGKQQLAGIMPSKSAVPAAISRRLGEEYATTQAEKMAQMQRGQGQIEEAQARNQADKYYLGGVKKMLPYAIGLGVAKLGVNIQDVIKDYNAQKQLEYDARIRSTVQNQVLDKLEEFSNKLASGSSGWETGDTAGFENWLYNSRQWDPYNAQIEADWYKTPFGMTPPSPSPTPEAYPMNYRLTPVPQTTLQPDRTGGFNLPTQTPVSSYQVRGGY